MYFPHFVYHSSVNGHLGCFYLLAIVNDVAMNMGVQIPLQVPALILLGIYTEVGCLDHRIILRLAI